MITGDHGIDLEPVRAYPITNFPQSLAHAMGTMATTEKSNLMKTLEKYQECLTKKDLPEITACIIDGGELLYSSLAGNFRMPTFGDVAKMIISQAMKFHCKKVYVLFDTYKKVLIKAFETLRWQGEEPEYKITGHDQSPGVPVTKVLKNSNFKQQHAKFLIKELCKDHYAPYLGNKKLYVSLGGNCVLFSSNENSEVLKSVSPSFQGTHEEVDTLIAFHAWQISGNILVRASDTDVLVIHVARLGTAQLNEQEVSSNKMIMDACHGNSRRLIDVSTIHHNLEQVSAGLSMALSGLHAFSGYDYTSYFNGKGKIKPWMLMIINSDYEELFRSMGSEPD